MVKNEFFRLSAGSLQQLGADRGRPVATLRRQRGRTRIKRAVSEKQGQRGNKAHRRDDRNYKEVRARCQCRRTRIKRAALENEVSATVRRTGAMKRKPKNRVAISARLFEIKTR